ncbi:MAG: glutamate--cysteine ligase [Desulfofustis sp.]|nr:glutamate--cysteine ligase [Desulfofustis sp.]
MESILNRQLKLLAAGGAHLFLKETLHGVEKEGLRVDSTGTLSQKPHPQGLGSALTNSNITTDFSESQLELITPVYKDPETALQFLRDLHCFVYSHLDDELIWAGSMPCHIPDPARIPIARYGSSNVGRMKSVYRIGLKHRYGKLMQSIAGIHYNFSLSDQFWKAFQAILVNTDDLQLFRSASYFKMIRNFRRHSWLLLYLFGASPVLCESFLKDREHQLQRLHGQTLYLPHATSLRMSDLGYSTRAQSSLDICFNHLSTYVDSLRKAIQTTYPSYEKIGIKVNGRYRQLNDTILQIENEHYSDVRPKRVTGAGERPLHALRNRGVEYIEIRNTDVNPLLPLGIDLQQALFLDTFLISCLLMDEQVIGDAECRMVSDNTQKVITRGRKPGLMLSTPVGEHLLTDLGTSLLDQMLATGQLLDEVHATKAYSSAVEAQIEKLRDQALTPSAQVISALQESGADYTEWVLLKSQEHRETFGPMDPKTQVYDILTRHALDSIKTQRRLEESDTQDFDAFLKDFLAVTK